MTEARPPGGDPPPRRLGDDVLIGRSVPAPPIFPAGTAAAPVRLLDTEVPATPRLAWQWIMVAFVGFLVAQVLDLVFGSVAGALDGKTAAQVARIAASSAPPQWFVLSSLVGVWVGFAGAPWVASRMAGTRRFVADIGLRFRPVDLLGIVIGLAGQLVIALLYAPFQHDITNYNGPTTRISGSSHGSGVLLIVLATAILAPLAEELFFRGLLFKGLLRLFAPLSDGRRKTMGVVLAVVVDGLLFGLAHGEWVQLAGLALFGMVLATVSYRTGRLGMNIVAHASFNLIAVLVYYKVVG
jgi:hypothetical protein